MKPSELFGVAVRIIGLMGLLYLVSNAVVFIGTGAPWQLVVRTILLLLLSLYLLRGAPHIVRFAYSD